MSKKTTKPTIRENRPSNVGSIAYKVKRNSEHQQHLILSDKMLYLGGNRVIIFSGRA